MVVTQMLKVITCTFCVFYHNLNNSFKNQWTIMNTIFSLKIWNTIKCSNLKMVEEINLGLIFFK